MANTLNSETRQLAAMTYGESSTNNDVDEMFAIANVLVRQRDARGYQDIMSFAKSEPSFSFVVADGNSRYKKLMNATEVDIRKDAGMSTAIDAAENALNSGLDKSNGAFFWDGRDIKTNYSNHFKVKHGIKFLDPAHNIYHIKESTKEVIIYKIIKIRNKKTNRSRTKKVKVGRYDHVYESTAAYGGTIFWKFNPDYLNVTHAKEYK